MRKNVDQINKFLKEVELAAGMEHPHIVRFIGVAWKMLADLCVVMEYMEGGDLRSLLDRYLSDGGVARGFNRDKTTIAFQVCQALTYMHSLPKPVIHRDLKSRNILLTRDMQAKLTDFGISRERLDNTMTAGMGTMLWMAPEVMKGERYDEKADMFSFGVVLSELDVHTLPYASAKVAFRQAGAHELSDMAILQQVASGKLRVDFSVAGPKSMVQLGCECVSVDPGRRPTAAQALYRLQVILAGELS